ncbi:MAG: hypothetical protein IJP59_00230 [Muribaculaceae bacterium]|nr:hypothetical protein [Muribaculaceae bacterium]
MKHHTFKFHVQSLSFGWCQVIMLINDKEIYFNASYLGPNPLETLIDACADLMEEGGDYYISWEKEPGTLKIDLYLDEKGQLHFDISNTDNDEEVHETIPFDDFVSVIVSEGFRVLNAFGLYGFRQSWQNNTDFPLTNLLRITGKCKEKWQGESCCTDISKEIECLQKFISKLKITTETKMGECVIYYESWQIQCCGEPFSVGDKVDWTGFSPSLNKNAHGIVLDFDEEHYGFATHSITGTVTKILAERSEFPKGQRQVWYERAQVIHEELQHADGWESQLKDDNNTERTFWGYIVTLKDVTIKPLDSSNNNINNNRL